MIRISLFAPALIVISAIAAHSQGINPMDKFADTRILRVKASEFQSLPLDIVSYLERNDYTIPQCWCDTNRHNVISGSFVTTGRRDWAVLASRGGISRILVFWNGSTDHVDSLQPTADTIFLQDVGLGKPAYSRMIRVVGKAEITQYTNANDGSEVPPIEHDGIDDAFVDKGSTIYYYRDKWLALSGAD